MSEHFVLELDEAQGQILLLRNENDRDPRQEPVVAMAEIPATMEAANAIVTSWVHLYGYGMQHPAAIDKFRELELANHYGTNGKKTTYFLYYDEQANEIQLLDKTTSARVAVLDLPDTFFAAKCVLYSWPERFKFAIDVEEYELFINVRLAKEYGADWAGNLDGCDEETLEAFIHNPHCPQGLVEYANWKRRAMQCREDGFIAEALKMEAVADAIYKALPEDLRW